MPSKKEGSYMLGFWLQVQSSSHMQGRLRKGNFNTCETRAMGSLGT